MITSPVLSGPLIATLDGSLNLLTLVASGSYTTDGGLTQHETVDLTAYVTAANKASVDGLIALLAQQYAMGRANLLPSAQFLATDLSYLSAVGGATVAADNGAAYVGGQSAKVTTPGSVAGEGVSLALGTVPRGSTATVTLQVQAPSGLALTATLTDTANQQTTYTEVTPPTDPVTYTRAVATRQATASATGTGAWQQVQVALVTGGDAAPVLVLTLVTQAATATAWHVGAAQVQEA